MTLTDSLVDVTDYLKDLMEAHKADLGLEDVWYGDQNKLPRTPCVCIEPGSKTRTLTGAQRNTEPTFEVYLIFYFGKIQDEQVNRRDCDLLAEAAEALIHAQRTFGDTVVHSMVTSIESGYSQKDSTIVMSSRMTVTAYSRKLLPS